MRRGRRLPLLELSQEQRTTLQRWTRSRATAQALSMRARIEAVIVRTLESKPPAATRWSTHTMAQATCINQTAIQHPSSGIKPQTGFSIPPPAFASVLMTQDTSLFERTAADELRGQYPALASGMIAILTCCCAAGRPGSRQPHAVPPRPAPPRSWHRCRCRSSRACGRARARTSPARRTS